MAGVILVAAGGTGGHLFPAEALAGALGARGWRIHLATDHRVDAYGQDFPAERIHVVPSATITRSPVGALRALIQLAKGYMGARRLVRDIAPSAAIGFGGYPTVPPILAAARAHVPTVIHEANAVLGRANRFLGSRVTAIATSVAHVGGAGPLAARMVETGNPVRPAVLKAAEISYPSRQPDDDFRLLVFGGSQGARFMADLVPPALARLADDLRHRVRVTQQCRPEDLDRVAEAYRAIGFDAALEPFFRDLPRRIADSHLVICRSGASTVGELTVIGRPALMVPLPHALDQDQKANAEGLARAGGGWMIEQKDMTPERLASDLVGMIKDPDRLKTAAAAARSLGRPDAVERLADLVERVAAGKPANALEGSPA
jgi:UDP-N-acetylglucosamine--N-acetylmuramyl-(pentapeptide) pyrophosphoryl-undecaprenol N-acetylglucosamine transferase